MPYTVENQSLVTINKKRVRSQFLQIANEDWMRVNKEFSPYALQLYLYLASNANGFELALSPAAAERAAGIKPTSFHKYFKLLQEKGSMYGAEYVIIQSSTGLFYESQEALSHATSVAIIRSHHG